MFGQKKTSMQTDMTTGNPMPIILKFTLPLLIGNIFQQLYNMADTMIVGNFVGEKALAAVGSTGTIMFLVLGFCAGMSSGFTVLTSQKYGARDERGVKSSVANAIILSAVLVVVITILSLSVMKPLLHMMNTPDDIFGDAYTYISIICLGTVASVFYNLFSACLRAVGNSKVPLYFLVFSAFLNVGLDLFFIIVMKMGVAGAAWATVISQGVSAVLCFLYIVNRVPELTPDREDWAYNRHFGKLQLSVGLPMALQFGITASGTMVMQSAINTFGSVAVAGVTAAQKVQSLVTQGFMAMGQTMAAYSGQNFGRWDLPRIRAGVKSALIIDVVYAIIASIVVIVALPVFLPVFFEKGTDIVAMLPYARIYIVQCAIFYIPLSMIFVFRNTMQGCGFGFLPMMGGVVEFFARMLAAVLAIYIKNFNLAVGCDPIAWIAAAVFTAVAWLIVAKKIEEKITRVRGGEEL